MVRADHRRMTVELEGLLGTPPHRDGALVYEPAIHGDFPALTEVGPVEHDGELIAVDVDAPGLRSTISPPWCR